MSRRAATRRPTGIALAAVLGLTVTGCGTTVPLGSSITTNPNATDAGTFLPGPAGTAGPLPGGRRGSAPSGQGGTPSAPSAVLPSQMPPGGTLTGPASDRSPLTVGLVYVDNTAAATTVGLGAPGNSGRTIAKAFVAGLNARGGLHGRKLVTIDYGFSSSNANYGPDAAAACATFTQDHHVPVVLDFAFGSIAGFQACLQKAGVLALTAAAEPDRDTSRQAFLHAGTTSMTLDRTYSAVLTQLHATGYLGKGNTLGVIVEQCPETQAAYRHTILPLIQHLGLTAAPAQTVDCTTGFASAGPASSAISSAILAFRQADVDRVMFVSSFELVIALLFAGQAESQQYRPGYALSSYAAAANLRAELPPGQQPQMHGVGNVSAVDTERPARPSVVEKRCESLAKAGGVTPASTGERGSIYIICAPFLLLEAALVATNGQSTPALLRSAIAGLGTSFVAPGIVRGLTLYTTDKHDGPTMAQVFSYQTGCSCVSYSGQAKQVPA